MELVKISRIISGIIPSYDCTDIILSYYNSKIEVISPTINKDGFFEHEICDFREVKLGYIQVDKLVFDKFGYIKFKKYGNNKCVLNNDEKILFRKMGFKIRDNTMVILKNCYGNFEYEGLVFDKETEEVYGRQNGKEILNLTEDDIKICKKYRFKYRLSKN